MNLTKTIDKVTNGKWMMTKSSLLSLFNSVDYVANARVGGLYAKVFGNTVLANSVNKETTTNEQPENNGDIAVIGISGVLVKGASKEEEELLGFTNIDAISTALDEAANDPTVKAIVLAFASPGGETTGIEELGRKIKNIDTNIKPIFAWTEQQMCSAAYWLGSQTRYIGMSPSATIGSVGVYMLIMDQSKALDDAGIKAIFISSGKYKLMGHDLRSLTDEEKTILNDDVVKQHNKFKETVISNRPNANKDAFEGLSYEGDDALKNGLADKVTDAFEEFLAELKF